MTSVPSRLPFTNALSTKINNERSSSIRRAPPPPPVAAESTNSPVLNSRTTTKSPKRNHAVVKKEQEEVPVNVDEVAMINNIKEETERYNASSSSQDESLVNRDHSIYSHRY